MTKLVLMMCNSIPCNGIFNKLMKIFAARLKLKQSQEILVQAAGTQKPHIFPRGRVKWNQRVCIFQIYFQNKLFLEVGVSSNTKRLRCSQEITRFRSLRFITGRFFLPFFLTKNKFSPLCLCLLLQRKMGLHCGFSRTSLPSTACKTKSLVLSKSLSVP